MNSSARKWQSIRKDQRVEIGLVQVDIGGAGDRYDHLTDLMLKRAKDVFKDALLKTAELHGGKLAAWEGDSGTFLFLIEGPDGCNNCCRTAMEMLDQLPSVKREVQLSDDLGRLIMIRIGCDTTTVIHDPETHNLPQEFVDAFKEHGPSVSAGNKVTLTERAFHQLDKPLKSRFVKWKHSTELGVDLYASVNPSVRVGPALAKLPAEEEAPPEEQATQDAVTPVPDRKRSPAPGWLEVMPDALKSRKMLSVVGAAAVLSLVIFWFVFFRQSSPPPVTPPQAPPLPELVQTDEWLNWRKQIHEKLSAAKVTESTLADAFKIKLPVRPEQAAAALRRDQAIADVLMAYPDVRSILKKRFGIYEDSFLGTGLSKPFTGSNYGAASVHEYLIQNLPDNDPAVWMRILDPNNPPDMSMTVKELFDPNAKQDEKKNRLVQGIAERVKENDTAKPALIRFASLNAFYYKRTLGRPDANRVFASNLAEVWNMSVKDAADRSGHIFTQGESVYVWAFLPYHPTQVVPATWGEVLNHLPAWLSEIDKN